MRKPLLLLIAVASLTTAGALAGRARPAATASRTVKITHTGYVPTSVSIVTGEAVDFVDTDTVAHTVSFKTTTGMRCSLPLPLVLQPATSATCTFSTAGKFNFFDPVSKGKDFRGTVSVGQPLTATLTVTPKAIVYGRKVTLAGALVSQQAGQSLQVVAQECGASASTQLGTVTTGTDGAFSFSTQPAKQTAYTVTSKNLTSGAAIVKVLPRLRLGKIARHRYVLRVFAAESFAGKYGVFQRYRPAVRRWRAVKRVLLRANATGVAPTVVTSASFRASLKAGLRIRVVLGHKQVGACYLAGRSNTIRS
ncbi:MAG: hypothetical protein ACJ75G_07865 [Gaiellaceae bacterium]